MTVISVVEARKKLPELMNRAFYAGDRAIIERRGKKLAAVVSIEDLELLQALEDKLDLAAAKKALAEAKGKAPVSWKKLKAELGL
jgi:prevent-host-death family protein